MAAVMCLTLSPFAHTTRKDAKPVRFSFGKYKVLFVNVQVERHDTVFILDTGSTITYVDVDALQLHLKPEFTTPVQAANQRWQARVYRLHIRLGEEKFEGQFAEVDLTGTLQACSCQVDGFLGMDVLSRCSSVEIDFRESIHAAHTLSKLGYA